MTTEYKSPTREPRLLELLKREGPLHLRDIVNRLNDGSYNTIADLLRDMKKRRLVRHSYKVPRLWALWNHKFEKPPLEVDEDAASDNDTRVSKIPVRPGVTRVVFGRAWKPAHDAINCSDTFGSLQSSDSKI